MADGGQPLNFDAATIQKTANDIGTIRDSMVKEVDAIKIEAENATHWQGEAAGKFQGVMGEIVVECDSLLKTLHDMGANVESNSKQYQAAEADVAAYIRMPGATS
ncbi:MAG: WXG100 family type VII secretion target [Mycobacteriaceae bacterium]|nr:WXG100 family type VII secretion target [Mycobacteriaceae bacterium]